MKADEEPPVIGAMHDRQCVLEQVHRLFWGIDARRSDVVKAACAPALSADWGGLGAGAFPDSVHVLLGGITTHHQCTNPLVTINGVAAEVDLLVAARYRRATLRGSDRFSRCSADRIQLRRQATGWTVVGLTRVVRMAEGNPAVLGGCIAPEPPARTDPLPPEPPPATDAERLARIAEPADGFVAFVRLRQRGHAAFHQYSNFQASVDGDHARCIRYMAARHNATEAGGDPLNIFVGWYDNEFIRTPQGWRLSALRHPLQWIEGNAAIKDAPDPEAEAIGRQLFESVEGT